MTFQFRTKGGILKKIVFLSIFIFISLGLDSASIRRFGHVKKFYKDITEMTIELCVEHNAPPAVILAIAGLESGYNQGYVAQITGNILSLGANKNETSLPALYLPRDKKSKKIIFDQNEYKKIDPSSLVWKKRPHSKKKDYRPKIYRGSKNHLTFFNNNPQERLKAYQQNIEDFICKWLNVNYKKKVFADARKYLDKMVERNGKEVLFNETLNNKFIEMIGGHPHSFNHFKNWPKKVKWIMNNAHLLQLVIDIHQNKMSFEEAWEKY